MDGFSYTNIFETKGIEYIAIIVFFMLLIPFWLILNKKEEIKEKLKNVWNVFSVEILKIPQGIYHCKNHTWAFLGKSGNATIGIDDFLLHTVGEIKIKMLKQPNDLICKGDEMVELINNDKRLIIHSPISGKISKTNHELENNSVILNNDPYGKGWIYSIKPSDWKSEINTFYLSDEIINWSKNEISKFKDFVATENSKYSTEPTLTVLQEGGELMDHPLSGLSKEYWTDFQESFLND
jgi:glycine cleavage system H protein